MKSAAACRFRTAGTYFEAGAGDTCSPLRFAALCRGAVFFAFFSECFFSVFTEPSAWVVLFDSVLLSDLVAGAAVLVSLPLVAGACANAANGRATARTAAERMRYMR